MSTAQCKLQTTGTLYWMHISSDATKVWQKVSKSQGRRKYSINFPAHQLSGLGCVVCQLTYPPNSRERTRPAPSSWPAVPIFTRMWLELLYELPGQVLGIRRKSVKKEACELESSEGGLWVPAVVSG